jgi:hypothetical protein
MRRKPLPKAITRSIANLQQIAAGFAADEQGRVPPHVTREPQSMAFDAVEPEPKTEPQSMPDIASAPQGADAPQPKSRPADPLAARRRALARRIVDRHKNYAAMGGLVPLPAANIALIAGAVPTGAGLAASSTLMWIVPGGLVWGLGAAALTAGALTRGIGLVFVDSFETAMAERSGA